MLERSRLPRALASALVEMLSEAAAEGRTIRAIERGLEQLAGWLRNAETGEIPASIDRVDDGGIDRLFRTLVPVITGRRSGHEIIHRLRRKWDLGHGLLGALEDVRRKVHDLADLRGPPTAILDRLNHDYAGSAPDSVAALRDLTRALQDYGVDLDRVEFDLGFGRGIGFYSRMIFELIVPTPAGAVEVCGGGRYDGLARVLGSPRDDRGVGFAFGLERLAAVLDAQGQPAHAADAHGFLIMADSVDRKSSDTVPEAIRLASLIRSRGSRAVLLTDCRSQEAVDQARRLGLRMVLDVNGPGRDQRLLALHDLAAGEDRFVTDDELAEIANAEAKVRLR
jgi:histidyl-tRNA synthetase